MCFSKPKTAPVVRQDPVAEQRKADDLAANAAYQSSQARSARRRRTALATGQGSGLTGTALQTYGQTQLGNFPR